MLLSLTTRLPAGVGQCTLASVMLASPNCMFPLGDFSPSGRARILHATRSQTHVPTGLCARTLSAVEHRFPQLFVEYCNIVEIHQVPAKKRIGQEMSIRPVEVVDCRHRVDCVEVFIIGK